MDSTKWYGTQFRGLRFRKHPTKKNGIQFDQYFAGNYQVEKKRTEIAFGWASEGWTALKAYNKLCELKQNARGGIGPTTLKAEVDLIKEEREEIARLSIEKQDPDRPENITLERFYHSSYRSFAMANKKERTARGEDTYFKMWIIPHLGHLKFDEITEMHIEDLKIAMLNDKKAPRTIQQCLAIFDNIFNYAARRKISKNNSPTKFVRLPKVENERTRFFSHEDATLLLERLKQRSSIAYELTLVSLHTGARRGEIFDLTWGVINFRNRSMLLRDAKGKPRHAFLTDEVIDMLNNRYENQDPSKLVFTNKFKERHKDVPRSLARAINALGFNAGVTDRRDVASFHTCRHTFASWHVQNGTDLYTLKELLGHSSIKVTERYAHLRPDGLKLAAKNFNKMLKD